MPGCERFGDLQRERVRLRIRSVRGDRDDDVVLGKRDERHGGSTQHIAVVSDDATDPNAAGVVLESVELEVED